MLIIFGGLPGTGKSSIARKLAESINALYLRIDSIESGINNSALNVQQSEDAGYLAAFAVAKDNLSIGHTVIADSVNPISLSREGWRNVAIGLGKQFLEIEIFCSDQEEHKRRLEARNKDVHNITPIVTWEKVIERDYELWKSPNLRFDTAQMSVDQCVKNIIEVL